MTRQACPGISTFLWGAAVTIGLRTVHGGGSRFQHIGCDVGMAYEVLVKRAMQHTLRFSSLTASLLAACAQPTGPLGTEDLTASTSQTQAGYVLVWESYCGREPCAGDSSVERRKLYNYVIPATPALVSGTDAAAIYVLVRIEGDLRPATTEVFPLHLQRADTDCMVAKGPTPADNELLITRGCNGRAMDEWQITHALKARDGQKALDVRAGNVLAMRDLSTALKVARVEPDALNDAERDALATPWPRRYFLAADEACTAVRTWANGGEGLGGTANRKLETIGRICGELKRYEPLRDRNGGPRFGDNFMRTEHGLLEQGTIVDPTGRNPLTIQRNSKRGAPPEWDLYDDRKTLYATIRPVLPDSAQDVDVSLKREAVYQVHDESSGAVIIRSASRWRDAEGGNPAGGDRVFDINSHLVDPEVFALVLLNTALAWPTYMQWCQSGALGSDCSSP